MATWAELTQEQRDVYATFERDARGLHGELQRLLNKAAALDTRWNAQMLGVLAALTDNAAVPNTSGLAGSSALDPDADLATLQSHLQGILTTYNTAGHQQMRAKACGQLNA